MAAGGSTVFKGVQYGKETPGTHGTAVPATGIWMGEGNVPKDRQPVYPNYKMSLRSRAKDSVIYKYLADGITLSLDETYFTALPLMFSGLKGGLTPTEVTSGKKDYKWLFTPSLTATNAPDSFTLEFFDDVQNYEAEYAMVKRAMLSGSTDGSSGVKATTEWFARQVTKSTKTPGLSLPHTDIINPRLAQMWYDPSWAAAGSTEKTMVIREWEFEVLTGLHPKEIGNNLYFGAHGEGYVDFSMRFTFEGDAQAVTFFDDYQAQNKRLIRLKVPGAISSAGGTAQYFQADVWGVWDEIIPLSGQTDDNNLYTGVFHGLYDETGAAEGKVEVVAYNGVY